LSVNRSGALKAILIGGLMAATLDLIAAYISFGPGVPRAIAGGLIGPQALKGGPIVYALGIFLHYFIAICAAAVYVGASRKLVFLKEHFLVCGAFYGIAVYLVMNLIVLPLSAYHATRPLPRSEIEPDPI